MNLILLSFALIWLVTPWLHSRMGARVFYVLAAVPALALIYVLTHTSDILHGHAWEESFTWVPQLDLQLTFRMDVLSWIMSLLVLGVGSLVLFYCASYFKHSHEGVGSFAAHLFSFCAAMFGLITADDFILMFVFWEITTILSYLLIGFSRHRLSARRNALQALIITTAGGLAMFIGIVMLATAAGTQSMHEIVQRAPSIIENAQAGTGAPGGSSALMLSIALLLILCGAMSKSALFPTHFWLPGAMSAPTPVSAYLHAAAMVKAGIYLMLRLAPGFGEVPVWHVTLVLFGAFTMLFGGWVALKQTDLKLILAYGTVSQLGFLTLILAGGTVDAFYAAIAMMLAHSLFKAALFLTVGIIDHQAGTRDIHKLSGLYRRAPKLAVIGTVSAASMAGVPPLAGFVAKEAVLEAQIHNVTHPGPDAWLAWVTVIGAVLGSLLTFAYSARFVWGAFGRKPADFMAETDKLKFADEKATEDPKEHRGTLSSKRQVKRRRGPAEELSLDTQFRPVGYAFIFAPAVLTVGTIIFGLYPEPVHKWITSYVKEFGQYNLHLALWHGVTPALLTSVAIMTFGVLMFLARNRVLDFQTSLPEMRTAHHNYRDVIDVLDRLAIRVTGYTQRGSLAFYLGVILTVAVVVPIIVLLLAENPPTDNIHFAISPAETAVAVLMIVATTVILWARKRFLAVLMASVNGYGIALIFALRAAPDLALTQMLVETISLVAFVLAMRVLPRNIRSQTLTRHRERAGHTWRIIIAVGFGVLMTALAAFAFSARNLDALSLAIPKMAYEEGDGKNIVNVILVDIRGWDTFGEISVLALAATGIASLLFIEGRRDLDRHTQLDTQAIELAEKKWSQRPNQTRLQRIAGEFTNVHRDPFIVAGRTLPPERRSILLEVMTRLLFHTLIMVSLYMLVAGHNLPGGGFAGGLLVGLALAVRYLAGGGNELQAASPLSAGAFLGLGLGIAALYAAFPLLLGDPLFTSYTLHWHLPIFGDVKFVTATIFDIGVYLLVIGLVLDVLRSLGQRVDQKLEEWRKNKNKETKLHNNERLETALRSAEEESAR